MPGTRGQSRRAIQATVSHCLISILLWICSPAGALLAQEPPIPYTPEDVEAIRDRGSALLELAATCQAGECPQLPCEEAHGVLAAAADARYYLEFMAHWIEQADAAHSRRMRSIAAETDIAYERLEEASVALSLHESLHHLGNLVLDGTAAWGTLDLLAQSGDLNDPEELLVLVDGLYENAKSLESAISSFDFLRGHPKSPTPVTDLTPEVLGFDRGEINRVKSTLSNALLSLRNLRDVADDPSAVTPVLRREMTALVRQIGVRYLTAYSEELIAERKDHLWEIGRDRQALELVQDRTFMDWNRVGVRGARVREALAIYNQLLGASEHSYVRCLLRSCERAPDIAPRATAPDFVAVDFLRVDFLPPEQREEGWGPALVWLNQQLPNLAQRLETLPELRESPAPALSAPLVVPVSELFDVAFNAPVCFDRNAWIGILPVDLPRHAGRVELTGPERFDYLDRRTEAAVRLRAPTQEGVYSIRMYDRPEGREVVNAHFSVRGDAEEPPDEAEREAPIVPRAAPGISAEARALRPSSPVPEPWRPYVGAWFVDYRDREAGDGRMYVVVTPGRVDGIVFDEDGPVYHDPGRPRFRGEAGVEGGVLTGRYGYPLNRSFEVGSDGEGRLTGSRRQGERLSGAEVWTRIVPRVTTVRVHPLGNGALDYPDMQNAWQYAIAPGNLPRIGLEIAGDGLPLFLFVHQESIEAAIDDPDLVIGSFEQNLSEGMLRVNVRLEAGARPGPKRLYLNGAVIPWQLRFERYPDD